jgi:glycosyltransferase involved in cell wall biosynthesis
MKIIHVMAGKCSGGAETYSTDVMLSLHKAGIDQMIVMSKDAPRFAEMEKAGLKLEPEVLATPFRFLQKLRLARLIRREKPDSIHTWMRRAASLVPAKSGLPVIGWFGGYYDPRHFQNCTHFVGVTKDIVTHMIRNKVDASRAFFIPTFPDIATIPPIDRATLATPRDAKVLLTLSRLHPKKGLDTFLEALALMPGCYGWLAGDGPLQRELENLATKLGIMDRVRFLGWRTDRAGLLRAADVCVLPSRYEPFGTVILEAWAAGVPLVACKSAGPAAHIEEGRNGLLVPIDDAADLANAMRRAFSDETLRQRLIAEGFAAYIKGYTRESVTLQWIQFYKQLIKTKSAA